MTAVPRTLLDIAGALPFADLRRALAEADHVRLLDPEAVWEILGRGHPGSSALRKALDAHLPELAQARSVLEERFLLEVERAGLPIPALNVRIEDFVVDCHWRAAKLVVELDGHHSHAYPAAAERDRDRELRLRRAGYRVLRYTWQQVTREPECVLADVRMALMRAAERN